MHTFCEISANTVFCPNLSGRYDLRDEDVAAASAFYLTLITFKEGQNKLKRDEFFFFFFLLKGAFHDDLTNSLMLLECPQLILKTFKDGGTQNAPEEYKI